jgi:Protein of unknown function (DUF2934)
VDPRVAYVPFGQFVDTIDHVVLAIPYFQCISPHIASHPGRGTFYLFSTDNHYMEKIMDIREFHAQCAVKISERIAANVGPRVIPPENPMPPGPIDDLAMWIAPHICEDRNACIAEMAYFFAQRRGFSPGHEMDDWLTAENEVDARLIGERCVY